MEKALLLIDDGRDHLSVLNNIKAHLKREEGISLTTKYVNPNNRTYLNQDQDPDITILVNGIIQKLKSIKPDLIIVDQFYSGNDDFQGLDVIRELRQVNKFKQCDFFLISGKRDAIVRDIFTRNSNTDSEKVKKLAKIIELKINSFLDKNFKSEAISLLKQKGLDNILPQKLRSYEDDNAVINSFSPKFSQLTFEKLAEIIEGKEEKASDILDEMFDLTLSHYIKVNEKLQ